MLSMLDYFGACDQIERRIRVWQRLAIEVDHVDFQIRDAQ